MTEYEYNKMAMGTDISISIVTHSKEDAIDGSIRAFEAIQQYEDRFSRFLPYSELSQLNDLKKMTVSCEFIEVLQEALALSTHTHAIFNPLLQISRLGYNTNFSAIDGIITKNQESLYDIDTSKIQIDVHTRTITLAAGQKLDFGGFLKGYLAEKIARSLMDSFPSYQGIIVNLGGDLHARGTDEKNEQFIFEIDNPITKKYECLTVYNASIATSGTYKRSWKTTEGTIHHILDPSGEKNPITDIVSVSVIHKNGGKSEAYTKVLLTLPVNEAKDLLKEPNMSYLLITKNGNTVKN